MKRSIGMAPCLVDAGHDVTVIMHDHPDNRVLSERMAGVKCLYIPVGGVFSERRAKSDLLAENKFDVIVYNSLCWRNAVRKSGASSKALALMEHCELESSIKNTSVFRRSVQSVLEWWSLWAFDGHICASRYLLDLFKRRSFLLGINRTIFWSPYAVDSTVAELSRDRAATDSGVKTIFHIGSVAINYGCLFMIDGLRLLRSQRTDWKARFVGKGRHFDLAKAKVIEAGLGDCVVFAGYIPESQMRAEIVHASLFLSHLNDTEQDWARCPSKLYYYMALGRPIVTSMVGENRIALGDSGFYYRADDPADFARAVSAALDAAPDWTPGYSADSVTWSRRTDEFLRDLPPILRANT